MRYKEPFCLTKRRGIWQYYCYDEKGNRRKYSTGQKQKGKAVEVCIRLYNEDRLVQKPKRKKAPASHAPSGDSPLFRNYARGFWAQDSKYHDYKIHIATPTKEGSDPLGEFENSHEIFQKRQSEQTKRNFTTRYLISLVAESK
jgi:hypothetical protein